MPAHRVTMRKTREILRLRWQQRQSSRRTARSCGVAASTVLEVEARARAAGLGWPLPAELDDGALERLLYPPPGGSRGRPQPDLEQIYRELKRKGVTLELLWQEYRAARPDSGYGYSRFCDLYRSWRGTLDVTMRQEHRAGEKLGSWLAAHIHAFEYMGGVSELVVPDNTKTGVTKACFYDPDLNPAYLELAEHYGTAILPTRVASPRDKAKVENAVLQVERWVLAPLRNHRFFSVAELNAAIRERMQWLNDRPLSRLDGTRRSLFDDIDRPALRALPTRRFEIAEWKTGVGVGIDYHVEFERHYYSVPYQLTGKRVDVRATATTVECFFRGRRVASHRRSRVRGHHSTDPAHRPASHRRYAEWTPARMIRWAESIGPETGAVVRHVLETKPHPEQGFRSCLGIIRLADRYSKQRVENACRRARAIGSPSYKSVRSILATGLDAQQPSSPQLRLPIDHGNLRGADYYR